MRVAGGWRYQSHPDQAPYVEQFVLECPVDYGATAFQTAWAAVLERHPGLSAQYDFSGARLVYRQLPAWDGLRSFETANVPTATEAERVCADQYRAFSIGSEITVETAAPVDPAARYRVMPRAGTLRVFARK